MGDKQNIVIIAVAPEAMGTAQLAYAVSALETMGKQVIVTENIQQEQEVKQKQNSFDNTIPFTIKNYRLDAPMYIPTREEIQAGTSKYIGKPLRNFKRK